MLLDAGRVRAAGPLDEVATDGELAFAAREDAGGVLRGVVSRHDPDRRLTAMACGADLVRVPLVAAPPGTPVRLLIPAREVILALEAPHGISVNNVLPATVCIGMAADEPAHAAMVSLALGGGRLLARITFDAAARLDLRPGKPVLALIKSMSVELVQDELDRAGDQR